MDPLDQNPCIIQLNYFKLLSCLKPTRIISNINSKTVATYKTWCLKIKFLSYCTNLIINFLKNYYNKVVVNANR